VGPRAAAIFHHPCAPAPALAATLRFGRRAVPDFNSDPAWRDEPVAAACSDVRAEVLGAVRQFLAERENPEPASWPVPPGPGYDQSDLTVLCGGRALVTGPGQVASCT
jgi:hypothetical protein